MSSNSSNEKSASTPPTPPTKRTIYHEKQVKALCALHALNNVLQRKQFSKSDLDAICQELSPGSHWFNNTHRSMLGIGNYDVNVITAALQQTGKELVWFDKRKDPADVLNLPSIFGFILNIRAEYRSYSSSWWPNFMRKHWIALRGFDGDYYEIDSKRQQGPQLIGGANELYNHLRSQLELPEAEVFLVLEKDVAESRGWERSGDQNQLVGRESIEKGLNVIDLNKS